MRYLFLLFDDVCNCLRVCALVCVCLSLFVVFLFAIVCCNLSLTVGVFCCVCVVCCMI